MKLKIIAATFVLLFGLQLAPTTTRAADHGPVGLGLMLGDPNGINAKFQFTDVWALDLGVGFGFFGTAHVAAHLDLLWDIHLKTWSPGELDLFFGVGAKLGFFIHKNKSDPGGNLRVGARAPVGLSFFFSEVPVDVFLEVAAGVWAITKVDFALDAAIGARYWF